MVGSKRKIPTEIRQIVYERDNETCQEPGCRLSRKNGDRINIHHIKPEQFGGAEDPANLITLCDIHHKMMHVEFNAFYPDSHGVLLKMNRLFRLFQSRVRQMMQVDDGYDLSPYLEYLTGSTEFRPGQLKAIRAAISGRDVLFVTPTGSGKSVCYQLPGLLADDPTLVISPLKALMKDQVRSLWKCRIPATYVNSDLSSTEKAQRFRFIRQHLYKFLFVAPERFFKSKDPDNNSLYQRYAYMVVDEAHEIDLWGTAFRASYSKLGKLRQEIGSPPVIALTASSSQQTQGIIKRSLSMYDPEVIITGFYRDNIRIIKHIASEPQDDGSFSANKSDYIQNLVYSTPGQKKLIFVPTKKIGEELQKELAKAGFEADFFHGTLDTKEKMRIQDRFTGLAQPELNLLISTTAFGMGIDIPNIRHIIHWAPALSIEDYYQQIGRAGRDGHRSYAHLLFSKTDVGLLEFIATAGLHNSSFKEEHGYSDADVENVKVDILKRFEKMLDLIDVKEGEEWAYIMDYFGQHTPTFWDRYGRQISDVILGVVYGLIALSVLKLVFDVLIFIFE